MIRTSSCLLLFVSAVACDRSAAPAPAPAPAATPEAAVPLPAASAAVLPIQAKGGLDPAVTSVLDDVLVAAVQNLAGGRMRVVGRADIDVILGFEKAKDLAGCSEVTCSVEIAGSLGVESLIAPTLGRLGDKYLLTLVWLRQQDGTVLRRQSEDLGVDVSTLDAGARRAAAALLGVTGAAAGPLAPSEYSGRWVGTATNTWDSCNTPTQAATGLTLTLLVESGGGVDGEVQYADGGPGRTAGRIVERQLTLMYGGGNSVTATLEPQVMRGTYAHRSDACPGGWGGTIELNRQVAPRSNPN